MAISVAGFRHGEPAARWSVLFGALLLASSNARADWYYFVMKVECTQDTLRIVDYSAYNEVGEARAREPKAIDVDRLSTWKTTKDDLKLPDKPLPYVQYCETPAGKYRVTLTNKGGGYSAPVPVVNVEEVSSPRRPKHLVKNLWLDKSHEFKRFEIVFSSVHPVGTTLSERW